MHGALIATVAPVATHPQAPYLSPAEATCWLECASRYLAVVSCAPLSASTSGQHRSPPDPFGAYGELISAYLEVNARITG